MSYSVINAGRCSSYTGVELDNFSSVDPMRMCRIESVGSLCTFIKEDIMSHTHRVRAL